MYRPVKPVRVRPITLLCIVGFEDNSAQIIIMTRQCVANKNHVAGSKVKVNGQRHSLHLNFVRRPVKPVHIRPITLLCMVGYKNNFAQIIIMIRRSVANKNHVDRLTVKVTVCT